MEAQNMKVLNSSWLQRGLATGFMLFLVKGLLWIGAAVWMAF
jgi:hypothetical protein